MHINILQYLIGCSVMDKVLEPLENWFLCSEPGNIQGKASLQFLENSIQPK